MQLRRPKLSFPARRARRSRKRRGQQFLPRNTAMTTLAELQAVVERRLAQCRLLLEGPEGNLRQSMMALAADSYSTTIIAPSAAASILGGARGCRRTAMTLSRRPTYCSPPVGQHAGRHAGGRQKGSPPGASSNSRRTSVAPPRESRARPSSARGYARYATTRPWCPVRCTSVRGQGPTRGARPRPRASSLACGPGARRPMCVPPSPARRLAT